MIREVVKLNLGCGKRLLPGYINIDLHNTKANMLHDLTTPLSFDNNSVDEILAEHIIEHFHPEEWKVIIRDWARVLKPKGEIEIHTPDILRCAENLLTEDKPRGWRWLLPIYGGYRGPGEVHKNGFCLSRLREDLKAVDIDLYSFWYLNDRKVNDAGFNIAVRGVKKCN